MAEEKKFNKTVCDRNGVFRDICNWLKWKTGLLKMSLHKKR